MTGLKNLAEEIIMTITYKTVNEIGRQQVSEFVDKFFDEPKKENIVNLFVGLAEARVAIGKSPTIEIISARSTSHKTECLTISPEGLTTNFA